MTAGGGYVMPRFSIALGVLLQDREQLKEKLVPPKTESSGKGANSRFGNFELRLQMCMP